MAHLRHHTTRLLEASIANNTHKVYKAALTSFNNFRKMTNLNNSWPVPVEHIVFFIAHHYEQGSSVSTISSYLSALSFKQKVEQIEDNTNNFLVKKLLIGFRKLKNNTDSRLPITFSILNKLPHALYSICSQGYENVMFKAAFTLAFFGFCRISELVFNADNPSKTIMLSDISFVGQCLHVNIRYSKTDQFGKSVTLVLSGITNSDICPVQAMKSYIACRPTSEQCLYLFCHMSGAPLTRYQFCAVLRKAVQFLGLDSNKYKSHSFRIGAATQCALNGIDSESIKNMGRWKSSTYRKYIRFSQKLFFKP